MEDQDSGRLPVAAVRPTQTQNPFSWRTRFKETMPAKE
jgi:hypothetical protein